MWSSSISALVSHRFARIVRELLPRNLEVTVRYYDLNDLQKCRTYLRSCDEDPELPSRTQSARLCWNQSVDGSGSYHLLNELLMRLTALRKLELSTNISDTNHLLYHLRQNPQLKLQDLETFTPGLRYEHILVFLKLPNIQVIDCGRLLDSSMEKPLSLPHLPSFDSTVKKHVLGWFPIKMETLNTILSRTPLLRELDVSLSVRRHNGFFSPHAISKTFLPFEYSLVDLTIGLRHLPEELHDGSRFDISKFTLLENIKAASPFLFRSIGPAKDRRGLWRLLPKSIRSIKVSDQNAPPF